MSALTWGALCAAPRTWRQSWSLTAQGVFFPMGERGWALAQPGSPGAEVGGPYSASAHWSPGSWS